jgi:hypothetical protein
LNSSAETNPLSKWVFVAPRLFLSPWFALAGVVYWIQPVLMALEAAELLLGLVMLTDIVLKYQLLSSKSDSSTDFSAWPIVAIFALLLLGAVSNPFIDRFVFGADEELAPRHEKSWRILLGICRMPARFIQKFLDKTVYLTADSTAASARICFASQTKVVSTEQG